MKVMCIMKNPWILRYNSVDFDFKRPQAHSAISAPTKEMFLLHNLSTKFSPNLPNKSDTPEPILLPVQP